LRIDRANVAALVPHCPPLDCGGSPSVLTPVGPAEDCAELLTRYAMAGCERVYLWPLGDEQRQLELVARTVAPQLAGD
jgi:hypothetical protein